MRDLVAAIRAIGDGGTYISQGAASQVAADDGPELTDREVTVCRLVALGFSTTQIAEETGLSTRTVESYRSRLNTKLGFENRRDLVAFALEKRLIP